MYEGTEEEEAHVFTTARNTMHTVLIPSGSTRTHGCN